jgi:hypothetical protein
MQVAIRYESCWSQSPSVGKWRVTCYETDNGQICSSGRAFWRNVSDSNGFVDDMKIMLKSGGAIPTSFPHPCPLRNRTDEIIVRQR